MIKSNKPAKQVFSPGLTIGIYLFILILSSIWLLTVGHANSFLLVNNLHKSWMDGAMKIITYGGDGVFVVLFSLIFLLWRIRVSLFLLVSYLLSGLLAQLLKRLVFDNVPRPVAFFKESGIEIYTIPGLDIPLWHSFPSGHTASAFALFFGLAWLIQNWWWKITFIFLASLVGYSRIYLAMHFPVDVLAGSLLGVGSVFLAYFWIFGLKSPRLDVSLLSFFKNRPSHEN